MSLNFLSNFRKKINPINNFKIQQSFRKYILKQKLTVLVIFEY